MPRTTPSPVRDTFLEYGHKQKKPAWTAGFYLVSCRRRLFGGGVLGGGRFLAAEFRLHGDPEFLLMSGLGLVERHVDGALDRLERVGKAAFIMFAADEPGLAGIRIA